MGRSGRWLRWTAVACLIGWAASAVAAVLNSDAFWAALAAFWAGWFLHLLAYPHGERS